MKKSTLIILSAALTATMANASTLTGTLTVDDYHVTGVSTSPTNFGVQVAASNWWPDLSTFAVELNTGQDYWLHVFGGDAYNWLTGFIGNFALLGDGHVFAATGDQYNTTGMAGWVVSDLGFGIDTVPATAYDLNGDGLWNNLVPGGWAEIDSDARWIWDEDNTDLGNAYLSLPIKAVNTVSNPTSFALFLVGLFAIYKLNRMIARK